MLRRILPNPGRSPSVTVRSSRRKQLARNFRETRSEEGIE